jgi:hypothetical protein
MSNGNDNPNSTPDKPVTPQFPSDRTELNDITPTIPQFPVDRIEKGEKSGDINKKDN